jgi:two-component system, sensor histidine kinase LadS
LHGNRDHPSLVLTDYQMPGGNGDVVLASVRQQWPGVPVVLLSATQMSMDPPSGHAHGAHPFDASLMKPIDLASLRSVIRRVLGLQADTDSTPHTPIP